MGPTGPKGDTGDSIFTISGSDATTDKNVYAPAFYESSDKVLKENIKSLELSLDQILSIPTIEFNFKSDKDKNKQIGTIAQEIEKVAPMLLTISDKTGYRSVEYNKLGVLALHAIKILAKEIQDLKSSLK